MTITIDERIAKLDDAIDETMDKIKLLKHEMMLSGMSDDFYFTNGSRDRDLSRLRALADHRMDLMLRREVLCDREDELPLMRGE